MNLLNKKMRTLWLFASLMLCIVLFATLKEQTGGRIQREKLTILHSEHLYPVFDTLTLLEKDPTRTFSILHIGDSHIQGNYFTDKIRSLLYADFGLGSKGLVFPFQVARTNTMAEVRSSSLQRWESRRNTQALFTEQLGITGRAIVNTTSNTSFKIRIPEVFKKEYQFDEVSVFYTPITRSCQLVLLDSFTTPLSKTDSFVHEDFVMERFKSSHPIHQVTLQQIHPGNFIFHGLVLTNSRRGGITYHVAGVNGSQYRNWSASSLPAQQSAYLKPNLIILSLGTNDANDFSLSTEEFVRHMDKLIASLQKANPGACFILTTPPDSYYKKKYVNKHVDRIRHAILLYAEEHQIACWDLYGIMGGQNSIRTWQQQGLAAQDLVHFTKAGYELQGELFYESFIKQYTSYATHRSE